MRAGRRSWCSNRWASLLEVFHHEVAGAGQNEIGTKFSTLVQRADWTQVLKYVVWNVANTYGKTATFMPKPSMPGDNGSGMHVHQSILEGRQEPASAGDVHAGLVDTWPCTTSAASSSTPRAERRHHQPRHQQLQAPGARLRSPAEAGLPAGETARPRSCILLQSNPKGRRIEQRAFDPSSNPTCASRPC